MTNPLREASCNAPASEASEVASHVAASSRRLTYPRLARIRKRPHFLQVQTRGKRFQTRVFTLLYRPNEVGMTRFGITASKKVGNSPIRNRIKRLARESFRQLRYDLPVGFDLVVVARSEAAKAPLSAFTEALQLWAAHMTRPTNAPARSANP